MLDALASRRELFALLFPDVVHKLGNLLGNVQGRVELMQVRTLDEAKQREYLGLMQEKLDGVGDLLRDWVVWLYAEDLPPEPTVPVETALSRYLSPLLPVLERHNLVWEPARKEGRWAVADYAVLERVIGGVLAHFVEDTPPYRCRLTLRLGPPATVLDVQPERQDAGGRGAVPEDCRHRQVPLADRIADLPARVTREDHGLRVTLDGR